MDHEPGYHTAGVSPALLSLILDLQRTISTTIVQRQASIATFFDAMILGWLRRTQQQLSSTDRPSQHPSEEADLLRRYHGFRFRRRLVRYAERAAESRGWKRMPWEPTPPQLAATQGVDECLTWRGRPLFKSVFDFALYPMIIWEVKPRAIIELGSGMGAGALWFADLLRLLAIDGHVYSVDLHKPELADDAVTFIEGDCHDIDCLFTRAMLDAIPAPWLIVEDAHVNTLGVLLHFARWVRPGDYVVVEDSAVKQAELAAFDHQCGEAFRVDTRYTDYFGRNATSSRDSIFARI